MINDNHITSHLSTKILPHNTQRSHCDPCIQHRHQIICIFMCTSLQLFCLPPIQPLMMINCLPLQCFDLCLQPLFLNLFILLLSLWPLIDPLSLLLIPGKLLLLLLLVLITTWILHLELRYIIPRFVLVCPQIQLHYRTVSNWQYLSFLHFLQQTSFYRICMYFWQLLHYTLTLFTPFNKDIPSTQIQCPFIIICSFITDLYPRKQQWKHL